MAIKIITQVWDYPHLRDQSQLLVMLALADYSNDLGESFPRVDTLAEKARISERHVQKILSHLEKHGLLTIERGAGKGKKPWLRTNLYRINIAKLAAGDSIPQPVYKQSRKNEKTVNGWHNDTPNGWHNDTPRGGIRSEHLGADTPVIMPPKPSVREPSQKETTTRAMPDLFSNGHSTRQPVVVVSSLASEGDEPRDIVDKLTEEFGLSIPQGREVEAHLASRGAGYVIEKSEIVRNKKGMKNMAGAFMKSLSEDWKAPKSSIKQNPSKTADEPEHQEPSLSFEDRSVRLAKMKSDLASAGS
jgi:hypothetical protein